MGNMNYPDPKSSENKSDYKEVLNTLINQYPNEITVVTLGPLTNLGQFVLEYPESYQKIKDIYIMGGASTTVGNVTPAAEYNIWCDPEAADIVFQSGHPDITMIGWELCRGGANLTESEMDFVYSFQTAKGDFAIDCNKHALDSSQNWLGDPGLGLPDPVAMAVALNKKVVLKAGRHNVKIVLDGPARGMTIVDELNVGESEPHIDENWSHTTKNINVIWEINNQEWKETLYKTLKN
jgi:purine nucleosidase